MGVALSPLFWGPVRGIFHDRWYTDGDNGSVPELPLHGNHIALVLEGRDRYPIYKFCTGYSSSKVKLDLG